MCNFVAHHTSSCCVCVCVLCVVHYVLMNEFCSYTKQNRSWKIHKLSSKISNTRSRLLSKRFLRTINNYWQIIYRIFVFFLDEILIFFYYFPPVFIKFKQLAIAKTECESSKRDYDRSARELEHTREQIVKKKNKRIVFFCLIISNTLLFCGWFIFSPLFFTG